MILKFLKWIKSIVKERFFCGMYCIVFYDKNNDLKILNGFTRKEGIQTMKAFNETGEIQGYKPKFASLFKLIYCGEPVFYIEGNSNV